MILAPNIPKRPRVIERIIIDAFAGINVKVTDTQIAKNQAVSMPNMTLDEVGKMRKRPGYKRIYQNSLGNGAINGIYEYEKIDGTKIFLISHGGRLYTQSGNNQPVEISNLVANHKTKFFEYKGICYMLDSSNFLMYDGTKVSKVTDNAYIPTLYIGKKPDGSNATRFEYKNYLTAKFKEQFTTDGTATKYYLCYKNIDTEVTKVWLNGNELTEGKNYTVDRNNGYIDFSGGSNPHGAPEATEETANNLTVQVAKTEEKYTDMINHCTVFTIYGGSQDTKIFLSGNPDYPNRDFASYTDKPNYFPDNLYTDVDAEAGKVIAYKTQYQTSIIFKNNKIKIRNLSLENGAIEMSVKPLNGEKGCIASDSLALVNNKPIFLSNDGINQVKRTDTRDERNVDCISDNINPQLLKESRLNEAIGIDYNDKYLLFVNNKVYVYYYNNKTKDWIVWINIPASCVIEKSGYLYFGSNKEGIVYRFKKTSEKTAYDDDNTPIECSWISKKFYFDDPTMLDRVDKIFVDMEPGTKTSINIYIRTNLDSNWQLVKTQRLDLFNYSNIIYSKWTYGASIFPQNVVKKIKKKKIAYIQVKIENKNIDESLGVLSITLKGSMQREVK